VIPVDVAWNMVRLLPDADLAVFASCGHWTQIERAGDFNEVVGQFFRSTS
jgi:pimeloyl-ACP methyl ester carboxylesterase